MVTLIDFMEKKNPHASSETIRKASFFCFEDFYNYGHAHHIPRIPESFLEWFIGFFEGDGSLSYTQKRVYNRERNGKSYTERVCERLQFSIVQKERHIIEKIAITFGFGRVSYFTILGKIYWRWVLDSKKSFESMAYLLSSNLILQTRQQQFLDWVRVGQTKGMFQTLGEKAWSSSVDLNNAWLSGFIDAEGCFYASLSLPPELKTQIAQLPRMKKHWSQEHYQLFEQLSQFESFSTNGVNQKLLLQATKAAPKLKQKFTLTQLSTHQTNAIFQTILFLFKGTGLFIFQNQNSKKLSSNQYVRLELSSSVSHTIIIDYLGKYPLKTLKHVSFTRWKRVYIRRKDGVHLTPKGTKRLYRLIKAINVHSKQLYNRKYKKTEVEDIVQFF